MAEKEELKRLQAIKEVIGSAIESHNYMVEPEDALVKTRNILINFLRDDALSVSKENNITPKLMRGMISELMCEYLFKFYMREQGIDEGNFISNVMISKEDGTTTQLDAVCIIDKSIFVIECKSLYGPLFISEGNIKTKTIKMTPWSQNEAHIRAMKKYVHDYKYINAIYLFGLGIVREDERLEEHIIINNGGLNTIRRLSEVPKYQNESISPDLISKLNNMRPSIEEEYRHIANIKKIRELINS